MKLNYGKANWTWIGGLVLVIPAVYFILISLLKYALGWDYPYDVSYPLLERLGIREGPGLNINLLILLGPVLALLLNLPAVFRLQVETTAEKIECRVSVTKRWHNLLVILISAGALLILFLYLVGENCHGR